MSRRYFDQSERSNYDDSYRSGRSAVDISDKTPQFNNTSSANNSRYNGSHGGSSSSYMPSAYQQTVHEEYEDGYDDDPFGYDGDPLDDSGRTGTSQLTDATSGYGPQVSQYNNSRGDQQSAHQSGINSLYNGVSSRGQLDSSGRMGRGNTYSNSTGTTSYGTGTTSYDTSYDTSNQSSSRRTSNQSSSSIDYHSMGGGDDQRSAYSYNNDNNTSMVDQSARSNQQRGQQQQQYVNQLHQQQYNNTGSSSSASVVSGISRRNTRESDISSVTSHQQSQYTKQYSYGSSDLSLRTGGTNNLDIGKSQTPYQIEFNVTNTGKKITGSKRIIHFRFGFANSQALKEGKVGTDCRGDEHDIIIQWSITGGKRTINMDGREVQYQVGKRGSSTSRRADILEASWRIGNHTYDLKCYAYKPSNGSVEKRNPYWKQYSLLIDERSYFDLPQIFDLGEQRVLYNNVPVHQVESNNNDLGSSRQVLNTRVAQKTNTLNQSADVKNAIQNRIAQQRKLMDARKKEKHRVVPPPPQPQGRPVLKDELLGTTMGFETMNVDDSNRTGGVESSIFSAAPSELLDRSDRRPDYNPAQYETTDLLDESNRSSASEGANLFATAPSELEQARNRADLPPPAEAAAPAPSSNTGNEITPWVKQPTKPPPTKADNDWQPEPINNISSGASTCSGQQRQWSQYHQQQQQKRDQYQREQQQRQQPQAQQQTNAMERRRLPPQQQNQGQQDWRGSQASHAYVSPMQRQKQQAAARAQDSSQQQATKNNPPQAPPSGSAPWAKPLQIEAGQRRESQLSSHRQIEAGHSSTSKPPTMDDIMHASSASIGSGRSSRNKFAFF